MILPAEETARFYRIWFPLLRYVNEQLQLVTPFPITAEGARIAPEDAVTLRDALWADNALRERFIADNPAQLPSDDLALVESWRYRLAGKFFIERYLKKYTIFLSDSTPARAYGVLGLVAPIEEIVGPFPLPVLVQTVLLPFDGRIIYDSLLQPYNVFFGSGIRADLKAAYRDAQEREGIITTLLPPASEDREALRGGVSARNARLLNAFRGELARSGLTPRTAEQHVATIDAFAQDYLLAQEPPRGLLTLTPGDLQRHLDSAGTMANPISFRRFVRFLEATGRLDPWQARDLLDVLKGR